MALLLVSGAGRDAKEPVGTHQPSWGQFQNWHDDISLHSTAPKSKGREITLHHWWEELAKPQDKGCAYRKRVEKLGPLMPSTIEDKKSWWWKERRRWWETGQNLVNIVKIVTGTAFEELGSYSGSGYASCWSWDSYFITCTVELIIPTSCCVKYMRKHRKCATVKCKPMYNTQSFWERWGAVKGWQEHNGLFQVLEGIHRMRRKEVLYKDQGLMIKRRWWGGGSHAIKITFQ